MQTYIIDLIDASLGEYTIMGGKGSGNWAHRGRKGKRGGSAPRSGAGIGPGNFRDAIQASGIKAVFNKSNVYKKDGGAYTLRDKDGKNWGYIVKNREQGYWELRVDRKEYGMGVEEPGKYGSKQIAKFTDNLGLHTSPDGALHTANIRYYGLTEKTVKATRFRTEKAIPSFIGTKDWNNKNYRKKFQEATGHKLDKNVTLAESRQIARAMEGLPQAQKAVTFQTHADRASFQTAFGEPITNARAFYGWDNTIHFGIQATKDLRRGIYRGIDTTRHEYAHHIDYSSRSGRYDARSSLSRGLKMFDRAKETGRFMTRHSRKNTREFFATSFAELADAASMNDVGTFKKMFPEGHDMVTYVLGDRMPEGWK